MSLKFVNDLNIPIHVYFSYKETRPGAFSDNKSRIGAKDKLPMAIPPIRNNENFELHVEIPYIPFDGEVKGIKIEPGKGLGTAESIFSIFQKQRRDGQIVYIFVVKYIAGKIIGEDEPKVLHPEGAPKEEDDG